MQLSQVLNVEKGGHSKYDQEQNPLAKPEIIQFYFEAEKIWRKNQVTNKITARIVLVLIQRCITGAAVSVKLHIKKMGHPTTWITKTVGR